MGRRICGVIGGLVIALAGFGVTGQASAVDAQSCRALQSSDYSGIPDAPTQVISATLIKGEGLLPEHCAVSAVTAPHIGIELRIPLTAWNGKILQEGCGGSCGQAFITQAYDALARGYAIAATDQGHRGSLSDSKWAYNDITAELNAAYRATYLTQVVAEEMVADLMGQAPEFSYFRGSSNGGRQALRSAQVFPGQFDGIIAGCAPPGGDATLNGLWGMTVNFDEADQPILTADILPVVHQAAVAACDGDDGVLDGVIGKPAQCTFKPADLACSARAGGTCLTDKQVEVLELIYQGPKNSTGESLVIAGPGIGSELNWRSFVPSDASDLASQRRERRIDSLRYTSFLRDPGPSYSFDQFDWDRDPLRMRAMAPVFSATNPDLRALKAAEAKMMMYIGTNDYIPTSTMTDYYEAVERVLGGEEPAQDTVRLFVIPGMNHCIGGPGAGFIDYLTYLENWVEYGQAPDQMIGHAITDWEKAYGPGIPKDTINKEALLRDRDALTELTTFTRPHFAYPDRYLYDGQGDPALAENFQPIRESDWTFDGPDGIQGIGWYVLRSEDGGGLVKFYRDALGLGDFRSWADGGMLWAGGPSVFEPNEIKGTPEVFEDIADAPFIPIFQTTDWSVTLSRLTSVAGLSEDDIVDRINDVAYFRDPKGNFFGLQEKSEGTVPSLSIKSEQPMARDLAGLSALEIRTANPEVVSQWYANVVGLTMITDRGKDGADMDAGAGTVLRIKPGGSLRPVPDDREQMTSVPVYRVYGLDALVERLAETGSTMVQLFDQTGGRIWYGLDPDNALVGFQERRLPSKDLSKWTTRLPEDIAARRLWQTSPSAD